MITYNTPDFPLYYIDDRMLSFLDYPNQTDFATAIKGAVINCVRAEDRESLRSEIAQALMSGNSYTTTYRMLCRDKGYIWVKETGVQTVLPNGESVLVSLCLDITGQVEAQAELESIVQCPIGRVYAIDSITGRSIWSIQRIFLLLSGGCTKPWNRRSKRLA